MAQQNLDELVRLAQNVRMSPEDREKQRRSFAYGNTKVENRNMTIDAIAAAAKVVSTNEP
jgi:hypothetical protein